MSHRGSNVTSKTPQIWDGTKWVSLEGMRLSSTFDSVASTLWKGAQGQLGWSSSQGLIESTTHRLDSDGGATSAILAKEEIFSLLDAVSNQATYTLPSTVNGVAPQEPATILDTNRLTAEITITVNRVDGSSYQAQKWLATWHYVSAVSGYVADTVLTMTDNTPVGVEVIDMTIGVSGSPGVPTFTVEIATADRPRYILDIKLTLYKMSGTTPP